MPWTVPSTVANYWANPTDLAKPSSLRITKGKNSCWTFVKNDHMTQRHEKKIHNPSLPFEMFGWKMLNNSSDNNNFDNNNNMSLDIHFAPQLQEGLNEFGLVVVVGGEIRDWLQPASAFQQLLSQLMCSNWKCSKFWSTFKSFFGRQTSEDAWNRWKPWN